MWLSYQPCDCTWRPQPTGCRAPSSNRCDVNHHPVNVRKFLLAGSIMLFKGWCRKLAIPLLIVFSLGWLVYVIGFVLLLNDKDAKKATEFYFEHTPRYLAAAGGLLTAVLAFLHAASPGPLSAFLGSLTGFVSVFSCMGFGHVIYSTTIPVYNSTLSKSMDISNETWLMFVGSYVAVVSWMFVFIAWNCFTYDWKFVQVVHIVDEDGNFTDNSYPARLRRNVLFAGVARKLAAVVLLFVGASWCLYITGLSEEIRANHTMGVISEEGIQLPFHRWAVCVVGLLAFLSAVGHAGAFGGGGTAMGIFTCILGIFFLTSVGYTSLSLAIEVYTTCHKNDNCYILDTVIRKFTIYQLSGGLALCLSWACLVALWPFYFRETESTRRERNSARFHQQFMRQVQDSYEERVPLLQGQSDAEGLDKSTISVF